MVSIGALYQDDSGNWQVFTINGARFTATTTDAVWDVIRTEHPQSKVKLVHDYDLTDNTSFALTS